MNDPIDIKIFQVDVDIQELLNQLERKRNQRNLLVEAKKLETGSSQKYPVKRKFKLPDAIEEILREQEKPMHAKKITQRAIEMGFDTTLNAVVATLVRYNKNEKRFIRTNPNTYMFINEEDKD